MNEPRQTLRPLSDEEITLWLTVTQSVTRRAGVKAPELSRAKSAKPVTPRSPPPPRAAAKTNPPAAPVLPALAPLERRARKKLSRGNMAVDAALDLHGLRQHEAHPALHSFLLRAQRRGAKIVLVVTGKGEGRTADDYSEGGVLRRAVPLWLRAPEWRGLVVGFEEAARQHGGAGALYIRIRRHDRGEG